MAPVTVLVAVSITDTVLLTVVGDVGPVPSGLTATPTAPRRRDGGDDGVGGGVDHRHRVRSTVLVT